jgi:hypothetical protein
MRLTARAAKFSIVSVATLGVFVIVAFYYCKG